MTDSQYILECIRHQRDSYIPEIVDHVDRMKRIAERLAKIDDFLSERESSDLSKEGGRDSCQ